MEASKTKVYHQPADAVWLITGCSSGIGKAMAEEAYAKGHRVIATARKPATLDYLPDEARVLKLALDVSSEASVDAAVAAALARFGRIDVLVNNAGSGMMADTEAIPESEARAVMETNFWGTVRLTLHAMRILREENAKGGAGHQGGVVMNVTSLGGRIGYAGSAFYHAAKFAVEGFTESVSKEVLPEWNIHFCIVEPGAVATKFMDNSPGYSGGTAVFHPAYTDENTPTQINRRFVTALASRKNFSTSEKVAAAMYSVVAGAGAKPIPLHLPLGPDVWTLLKAEMAKAGKAHDELRELSLSVGSASLIEQVAFLE